MKTEEQIKERIHKLEQGVKHAGNTSIAGLFNRIIISVLKWVLGVEE